MPVHNAPNDGRVRGLFLVNWIAPSPLGALNQVLATSVIQRIGTIIRNKGSAAWIKTIAAGDLSC